MRAWIVLLQTMRDERRWEDRAASAVWCSRLPAWTVAFRSRHSFWSQYRGPSAKFTPLTDEQVAGDPWL